MSKLIGYRILAFCLDYLIVIVYAMLLFGISIIIDVGQLTPFVGQLIGFLTLTLPVYLYFFLMERSSLAATIGKKIMNISVHADTENNSQKIFIRNFLKFLPWEIAHIGVYWIIYYSKVDISPPFWVWFALILPQVIVLGYIISIFLYKGETSFYDKIANTRIEINQLTSKNERHTKERLFKR